MNTPYAPYPPQPANVPPSGYPFGQPQGAMPPGYPPYGYPPPQEGKKKKKGPLFWIVLILFLLILAVGIFAAWWFLGGASNRDANADLGSLEGKTPEEIQDMLNKQVDEGMFNIAIASYVEFEDGTSPGEWAIENIPGNRYLMQVTVTRDDNGQVIYETGIIDPNYHIQRAPLDYDLPAGQYPCTAVFTALDPETEEPVGQAGAKLTVDVKN